MHILIIYYIRIDMYTKYFFITTHTQNTLFLKITLLFSISHFFSIGCSSIFGSGQARNPEGVGTTPSALNCLISLSLKLKLSKSHHMLPMYGAFTKFCTSSLGVDENVAGIPTQLTSP